MLSPPPHVIDLKLTHSLVRLKVCPLLSRAENSWAVNPARVRNPLYRFVLRTLRGGQADEHMPSFALQMRKRIQKTQVPSAVRLLLGRGGAVAGEVGWGGVGGMDWKAHQIRGWSPRRPLTGLPPWSYLGDGDPSPLLGPQTPCSSEDPLQQETGGLGSLHCPGTLGLQWGSELDGEGHCGPTAKAGHGRPLMRVT